MLNEIIPNRVVFNTLVRRHLELVCPTEVPEIDLPGGLQKVINVVDKLQNEGRMPGPLALRQQSENIMKLPENMRKDAIDKYFNDWCLNAENRNSI